MMPPLKSNAKATGQKLPPKPFEPRVVTDNKDEEAPEEGSAEEEATETPEEEDTEMSEATMKATDIVSEIGEDEDVMKEVVRILTEKMDDSASDKAGTKEIDAENVYGEKPSDE